MDDATGAAVATNNDNAGGAVVPPSSTKNKDLYAVALVAFEGACVSAFADGASNLVPWGTRTVAASIDLIVADDGIVVAIVIIVSRDMGAEGGVSRAIPPLLLSSSMSEVAALYLIPLLNVHH